MRLENGVNRFDFPHSLCQQKQFKSSVLATIGGKQLLKGAFRKNDGMVMVVFLAWL